MIHIPIPGPFRSKKSKKESLFQCNLADEYSETLQGDFTYLSTVIPDSALNHTTRVVRFVALLTSTEIKVKGSPLCGDK